MSLELARQVRLVSTFEQAAALTLRPMLELAERALSGSEFAEQGRIVRAMLHVRPDDGYRRLIVMEAGTREVTPVDATRTRLPSATAWRWVTERGSGIAVDVGIGRVQLDRHDPTQSLSDRRFSAREFASQESRLRLIARDVTHLYVLPLRTGPDRIFGAISLEAECRAAMGRSFIWSACGDQLQQLADGVAPCLEQLPLAHTPSMTPDALLPVIGKSMAAAVALLAVFAKQEEPILISGPTGSGKSRLARWCHEQSGASDQPFEILDLSSIPEELQLAELFGWKKGAFTGAIRDNPGLIARAQGGTLFIDEIDNLSPRAQAGLLHVLEERRYRPLGDSGAEVPAETRFIIGTNAQLQQAVREKRFREDLYYRINVLPVRLPALSERSDEIPAWARHFANRRHGTRMQGGHVDFTPRAEARLLNEPWPGNLRQLDNIVRRAYAIALLPYGGVPPMSLLLEEEHVTQAIAFEGTERKHTLVDALRAAALAFVEQAQRLQHQGDQLDLDWTDCFKGFVLGVAVERLAGNHDEAFRLLGREKLVACRNHKKVFKRELERVESFCAQLGQAAAFASAEFEHASENRATGEPYV
jgi:DNA-binding NtrC family response regulator